MSLKQNNNLITAIDIGGSHITVCLLDLQTQQVLPDSEIRHHIDSSATAKEVIAAWAVPILEANHFAGLKPFRLGIAMPGPFDYDKGICLIKGLAKYEQLYGVNVKELLAEALNITTADIRMVNDATAYLIGEHQLGSGKDAGSLLGVTLGTGFGSAWIMNGQLTDGDLYCFPFRNGVAEDYVSTRWLLKIYSEQTGEQMQTVKEMSEAAKSGNAIASLVFRRMGESLGEIIVQRFSPTLPERVVIGGNIARSAELFVPAAEEIIKNAGFDIEIVSAVLGEKAALMGAGCLWAGCLA